jgi:outer membrane protein OmpA-like peptidoglycan-associated protein
MKTRKIAFVGLALSIASVASAQTYNFERAVREPLSETINTGDDEMLPFITPDGNTLYYVRTTVGTSESEGKKVQVLFASKKGDDGKWAAPQAVNSDLKNTVRGVKSDGTAIYFAQFHIKGKKLVPKLMTSDLEGEKWSEPKPIDIEEFTINSGFFGMTASADGNVMVFSMEGKGAKKGNEDLYFSKKNGEKWSEPASLGAPVNTDGIETSPFLAPDGKTLFFASSGLGGLGDVDIFMTQRLDDSWQKWSNPINVGGGINSAGFDGYFFVTNKGEMYMMSANNKGDLYRVRFKAPEPEPTPEPEEPVAVKQPETPVATKPKIEVPTYPNITFEYKSFQLTPAAKKELDKLIEALQKEQSFVVKFEGHADSTGDEAANQALSEKRANTAKKYLTSKGVAEKRIQTQGFGENNPVDTNETEEGRSNNRRVEIKVTANPTM